HSKHPENTGHDSRIVRNSEESRPRPTLHRGEQTMSIRRFRVVAVLAFGLGLATMPTASAAIPLPDRSSLEKVDFERHIMGVLGRMGCNSGSCHGSFQGKGGFRLSLFGYDAEKDYFALTRDVLGRRINPVDPDRSLLLLKATGQIEHGGGARFARGSWQYQVL